MQQHAAFALLAALTAHLAPALKLADSSDLRQVRTLFAYSAQRERLPLLTQYTGQHANAPWPAPASLLIVLRTSLSLG